MVLTQEHDFTVGEGKTLRPAKSWHLGAVFEVTWHWWFGKDPVECLDREDCYNTLYQGKIHCDKEIHHAWEKDGWENIRCQYGDDATEHVST